MGIISMKWRKRVNKVNDLENAKTENQDIHYSRYIASWLLAGGKFEFLSDTLNFKEWLRSMDIPENEITAISTMAVCGKMELEKSARAFLEESQKEL